MRDRVRSGRKKRTSFWGAMRHAVLAVLFIVAAGCSGGGCSSGCSCAGVTPLAEGFKPEQRIENAASLRLTESGVGFLETNVGSLAKSLLGSGSDNGILTFEVPPSKGSFNAFITTIKYDVCAAGPKPGANPPECIAEIDLPSAKLQLDPQAPHNVKITGPLPVRIRKLPLAIEYFCVPLFGCAKSNVTVTMTGNDSCSGTQTFADINLDTTLTITIDNDPAHSRYGYSRIGVNVGVDQNKLKDSIRICGGFDATILNGLLGLLGNLIVGPLVGTLEQQIDQALCLKANDTLDPSCPAGTNDVDGICRYGVNANAECASIVLGTEGRVDFGSFLQGLSGGASGSFDFLLAAGGSGLRTDNSGEHWGDLNPIAKGITLGMYGGTEPAPLSSCVPPAPNELPTGIPIPDEVLGNSVSNWPVAASGPHFGLAISERFANYALKQLHNSGALCLGITADAIGTPVSSTLLGIGLGAKSLPELGKQKQPAAVAFMLRPQKPPTIGFGNGTSLAEDPLLDIVVEDMAIDFYIWSLDRYIRAMTVTTTVQVPANLTVTPDGLTPVIESVKLSNTKVSNHEDLIRDDPAAIAEALEGLVGQLVGSALGGALSPINLNSQLAGLGLTLEIPDTVDGMGSPGLRKLTKNTDDFLGLFGTLGIASMVPMSQANTTVSLLGFDVDPAGLRLETWTPSNGPRARLRLGSILDNGTQALEWQYRVDHGVWHPFSRSRDLDLRDPVLRNQGLHRIAVRSRIVGHPETLDREPAIVELRVDTMAPEIRLVEEEEDRVRVEAADLVSGDAVEVRVRFGNGETEEHAAWGAWSAWQPVLDLASFAADAANFIQVEARDEAENVGTLTEALLRGQADASASGCQCAVEPGVRHGGGHALGWLLGAVLAGGVAARRAGSARRRGRRLLRAAAAVGALVVAGSAPGCSCGAEDTVQLDGCRERGDCLVILPGLVGAYTSVAVAPDGAVWVAGYLEGNWDPDQGYSFGDLAVGTLGPDGSVAWKVVDGTSPDEVVDEAIYDTKGFRDGKTESGDDVGLWTSIAIDPNGRPAVAYYDATHHALKYAQYAGGSWRVSTVQSGPSGSDHGTYAKLRFVAGRPAIAYHFLEAGADGGAVSGVRLATGSDANGSEWTIEDVVADPETPCAPAFCKGDDVCLASGSCTPEKSGCMACATGEACVDDGMGGVACQAIRSKGDVLTYPNEVGLYVAMAIGSDGEPRIAYYDRPRGNVHVVTRNGGAWTNVLVDGANENGDTGDAGIGLSLAIDAAGDLHLAYVDGLAEALVYRRLEGGAVALPVELVDDGLGAMEGHHLVGDDANVFLAEGGEVRISYQDATTGELVLATGVPDGDAHAWTHKAVAQDGFAGFFSQQVVVDGQYRIANWWRVGNPLPKGDVRFVTP